MSGARILILEDDSELGVVLVRGLREEGFAAECVRTGREFLKRAGEPVGMCIIDIGLPDADGRDVCQALRARGVHAPVLFLTARNALPDRLSGFAAGGDDYLTKPFDFAELVVRLQALLRRGGGEAAPTAFGLTLDPAAHAAVCGGVSVRLTPTEFRILACLAGSPGDVVRRQALVQAAWPFGAIVHDNTLDAYIARLRRKLAALPGSPVIETAHGVGYALL